MKRILILSIIAFSLTAAAQENTEPAKKITYTSEADRNQAREDARLSEKANELAYYRYPVGKTFWLVPGVSGYIGFYKSLTNKKYVISYEEKFTPNVTVAFTVTDVVPIPGHVESYMEPYFYRVEIEDGTKALMKLSDFGSYSPRTSPLAKRTGINNDPAAAAFGLAGLYSEDPDKLRDRYLAEKERKARVEQDRRAAEEEVRRQDEKKQRVLQAKAAQDYKRKGGVRIGMSAKQVRASNWGAPESINRTAGSFGVHEQWVYDGGNYLYFENGILTTIQN
jgi:hypothetical protein